MTPGAVQILLLIIIAGVLVAIAVRGHSVKVDVHVPPSPAAVPAPIQVKVLVPDPAPVQVKVLLPVDIQKVTSESHTVIVEHRQPDGTWHRIGDFQIGSEDDPSGWPARADLEIATEGRRLILPSGRILGDETQ